MIPFDEEAFINSIRTDWWFKHIRTPCATEKAYPIIDLPVPDYADEGLNKAASIAEKVLNVIVFVDYSSSLNSMVLRIHGQELIETAQWNGNLKIMDFSDDPYKARAYFKPTM